MAKIGVVLIAVGCCLILAGSVLALSKYWSAGGTTTISAGENIKVHFGKNFNDPEISEYSFGNLIPGARVSIWLCIENIGNYTIYGVDWNSTASLVSDGKITDDFTDLLLLHNYDDASGPVDWPINLRPNLDGNAVWYVYGRYEVSVASDCPIGSYSWNLSLIP